MGACRCCGLLLLSCSLACSAEPREAQTQLEVFSWWTSGGEADAFAALREQFHRRRPDVDVINAAVASSAKSRAELKSRMAGGRPPDTFQANGGEDLRSWLSGIPDSEPDSQMEALDDLAESEGWSTNIPETVRDTVTFSGHTYGVPVDVHRTNTLFYNKQLFARLALTPPATLAELHAVATVLRANGVTPIALGSKEPWTLGQLAFEMILPSVADAEFYDSFFRGESTTKDPRLRHALRELAAVLDETNDDRSSLEWSEAVERVLLGKAGMTFMGDWAKGYLMSRGASPDTDFGEVPAPGSSGMFVFTTDTFGLPAGAPHRDAAIDFLKTVGSPEGQNAFNLLKGSIPARSDVDVLLYDALARRTIADFASDKRLPALAVLVPNTFADPVNVALSRFQTDRNVDNVIFAVSNYYDLLHWSRGVTPLATPRFPGAPTRLSPRREPRKRAFPPRSRI